MKNYLTLNEQGKIVNLDGWIQKHRNLGELVFFDLNTDDFLIQILVEKKNPYFKLAKALKVNDFVSLSGKVLKRKKINKTMSTGEIEVAPLTLEIISKASLTPFLIAEKTDGLEKLRMKYRYLDLRRPNIKNLFVFRSKFNHLIRTYFIENKFLEIETPYITQPSLSGANELLITSKQHKDQVYALTQSPQIYKQLLMYAGFKKYFQIARCFRDEDLRSDRQLEFTQLDLEIAFSNENEIFKLIEGLFKLLFKEFFSKKLITPFKVMSYDEAINFYGIDKPDLRYGMRFKNLTDLFEKNSIGVNAKIKLKPIVKAIFLEKLINKTNWEALLVEFQNLGVTWIYGKVINGKLQECNSEIILPIFKELVEYSKLSINNFSFIIAIGTIDIVNTLLGLLRINIAKKYLILNPNEFNFVWINKWPLFLLNNEKQLVAAHNPFSLPTKESISNLSKNKNFSVVELLKLKSNAYDLVLNGVEIGGGAFRINNPNLQKQILTLLKIDKKQIEKQFGWFLEAQTYGTPIHGGIALGLDRIIALLLKQASIKEIISFPKSASGRDEMTGAPYKVKVI